MATARRSSIAPALLLAAALAGCGGDSGMMHVTPPPAVFGSIHVTWTITSATTGNPLECSDLGAESAQILVGKGAVTVHCGDPQEATFTDLPPDRYPVIVRLVRLGTAVILEKATNAVVPETGGTVEAAVPLMFDETIGTAGSLVVRWRINDDPPATGCSTVGATRVVLDQAVGSRHDLHADVPCTDASVRFDMLPSGGYGVIMLLKDSAGATIATASIDRVDVITGDVTMPPIVPFHTGTVELARLFASWTINSTTATTACARANADAVFIQAYPEQEQVVTTLTATAPCDAGSITVERVPPGIRRHRVVFHLYSGYFTDPPLPLELTSTTARDILFIRGQTSTVSVDFHLGE